MLKKVDRKNRFVSMFDPKTGFYVRSGVYDENGKDTDIAHYYEHHHVSAYDSLFYISPALDVLYVAGLIQWHMRPFELERVPKSQKALEKFKRLIGEKMYNDVMALHEADIKAKGADAEDAA